MTSTRINGREWEVKYYDIRTKRIKKEIFIADNVFALITIIHGSDWIFDVLSIEQLATLKHY